MVSELRLDYETKSGIDLKKHGLDRYTADREAAVLMAAYKIDGQRGFWEPHRQPKPPSDLVDALRDPKVIKKAFNAQFERVATRRLLNIDTPYAGWRCTMVRMFLLSFSGGLGQIGDAVQLDQKFKKDKRGEDLIKMFTMPQRITKNQPHLWRDWRTDPVEWEEFGAYCRQDVISEEALDDIAAPYFIPEREWELYEMDQEINDRGIPIDVDFVRNAIEMAKRRQAELLREMTNLTFLPNPNSVQQLLPWLKERGYPFDDLQKDTVSKVLREDEQWGLDQEAIDALKLRQVAARASVKKYTAMLDRVGADGLMRFTLQYAGASRTARWAGRGMQVQNMARTPKVLEVPKAFENDREGNDPLTVITNHIRQNNYDMLSLSMEPMDALAGCVRSAIRAPDGFEYLSADLSSIETAVIAWLSGCKRLQDVFARGLDPYKDFATVLYNKPYDAVTKTERNICKPPVLGCGYRLGGGELDGEGKRTGLWGYAENMGVNLTKEESHKAVRVYRENYPEVPEFWKALERAYSAVITGAERKVRVGKLVFEYVRPFLVMWLPSGRPMYYYKPVLNTYEVEGQWGTYTRYEFSYMGKKQNGDAWVRIPSHGGKVTEQATQGTAREVLTVGLLSAHRDDFDLRMHVHDEGVALHRIGHNYHTIDRLIEHMKVKEPWMEGLHLGAAGWHDSFYRKD